MPLIALRYDLRTPAFGESHGDLYATALAQAAWADEIGLDAIVLSEHHGTDDGYLPSPLVFAGAVAARTERIAITIAALLLPLHEPLRLAEDLVVLDHIARGRASIVTGLGYRPEEFAAFGVDRARRAELLEHHLQVMRRAWTGEPFEYRGTTVQVRPTPFTPGGPMVFIGGSAPASARRAARLALPFYPAIDDPELAVIYAQENEKLGNPANVVILPAGPTFVYVSEDPDREWEWLGPHLLHDATTYRSWQPSDNRTIVESQATTVDELRTEGKYLVLTPGECVSLANSLPEFATLVLHPLAGGIPGEQSWRSLRLFRRECVAQIHRPQFA